MKTMLQAIGATIALSLLTVSPAGVAAQGQLGDPHDASQAVVAACAITQCLFGEPVRDAPFSAEATIVWRPTSGGGGDERQASSHYYRDSMGRVRVEQRFMGHDLRTQQVIVMPDPENDPVYLLDPATRTSSPVGRGMAQMMVGAGGHDNFVLPLTPRRFWSFYQIPNTSPDPSTAAGAESLGQRYIAGLPATGTRFTMKLPFGVKGTGRGERWVSPELKLVVYSRSDDAAIGTVEYSLTKISRAEPRAELFEVLADYAEIPVKVPLTWQNPYFPELSHPAGR